MHAVHILAWVVPIAAAADSCHSVLAETEVFTSTYTFTALHTSVRYRTETASDCLTKRPGSDKDTDSPTKLPANSESPITTGAGVHQTAEGEVVETTTVIVTSLVAVDGSPLVLAPGDPGSDDSESDGPSSASNRAPFADITRADTTITTAITPSSAKVIPTRSVVHSIAPDAGIGGNTVGQVASGNDVAGGVGGDRAAFGNHPPGGGLFGLGSAAGGSFQKRRLPQSEEE